MMTNATPNHTGSYPRPGPRQWAGSGHGERARGCGVEPARVRRRCPCAVSAAVFTSGEVGENRLDEFGSLDASDDAQSGAASGTPLDVDAKDALEPLRPAQRGSGRMEVALGGVSRVGGDVVTARPHAPHHLAVVRKRLATSLPRHRETGNKYQPLTCRRHPNNATYTRSPIRIGRLFFLYVELPHRTIAPSIRGAEIRRRRNGLRALRFAIGRIAIHRRKGLEVMSELLPGSRGRARVSAVSRRIRHNAGAGIAPTSRGSSESVHTVPWRSCA